MASAGQFHRQVFLVFAAFLIASLTLTAQEKPDTPETSSTTSGTAPAACCSDIGRSVSLRQLPGNLLADQKDIWLFPTKLVKGEHIWPTIAIVGITSGFVASDPYSAPPFRNTTSFSGFNRVLSSTNTGAFIAAVPAAMYAIGWARKDSYAQETALLAGEAFADGFLIDLPFKAITGRREPISYTGNGPYSDSFFSGTHNPLHSGGFYSVHSMGAMAVATVIARRYRSHRWVPFVAYGLAGAISFSRITRSDHFPGDVFFGGAMGFVIARYAVLPQRE
ncbi:MAG TPA: phosphatase PAP2 family protein [Candidatus Baltobacteraceae bacterium]|nr:phosphatase PAP2 family protein [Candidatus Baltobacteraceae bacterium]